MSRAESATALPERLIAAGMWIRSEGSKHAPRAQAYASGPVWESTDDAARLLAAELVRRYNAHEPLVAACEAAIKAQGRAVAVTTSPDYDGNGRGIGLVACEAHASVLTDLGWDQQGSSDSENACSFCWRSGGRGKLEDLLRSALSAARGAR